MSAFKPFVFGTLMGAAVTFVGLQYHIVRSDDGFYAVSRSPQASLGLAYADIRNMSTEDLAAIPELARAMDAHAAQKLLAQSDASTADETTSTGGGIFDEARDRLRSSNDWGGIEAPTIPDPNSSLDSPIWNPFSDDSDSDSDSLFDSSTDTELDDLSWPEVEPDPVAAQFEGDSPFADITDTMDDAIFDDSELGDAIENVASELDAVRDSFASRTRELADQFKQRNEEVWSKNPGTKPFDVFDQPTHSTNRVVAPEPVRSSQPGRVPDPRQIPRIRERSPQLRSSLNSRAREIYEDARRRASQPIDSTVERIQSRADSVIDELVAPRGNTNIDALESASGSTPKRYTRDKR